MNRSRAIATAIVAACCALVFGRVASAEDLKIHLVLSTPPQTTNLPFYVAQDLGWYKKNGLDVRETTVAGDANALRLLISGQCDVALSGPGPMLSAIIGGAKIKSIGSWQPLVDYVIIARKPIQSLSELKGKTIASIGPGEMPTEIPKMMMIKRGIDVGDVRFVSVGTQNARVQAILAGKGDATLVGLLAAAIGAQSGKLNTIAEVKNEFPNLGYIGLAVRNEALSDPQKRAAFKVFMKGSIEASRLTMREPAKAADVLYKRMKDVDLGIIKSSIETLNRLAVWGTDGGNDPKVAEFTENIHHDLGITQKRVSVNEMIDTSIVDDLVKDIGPFKH